MGQIDHSYPRPPNMMSDEWAQTVWGSWYIYKGEAGRDICYDIMRHPS